MFSIWFLNREITTKKIIDLVGYVTLLFFTICFAVKFNEYWGDLMKGQHVSTILEMFFALEIGPILFLFRKKSGWYILYIFSIFIVYMITYMVIEIKTGVDLASKLTFHPMSNSKMVITSSLVYLVFCPLILTLIRTDVRNTFKISRKWSIITALTVFMMCSIVLLPSFFYSGSNQPKKKKVVKLFYEDHKTIFREYEINDDSIKDGYYKSYYKSGQIHTTANYFLGKINGKEIIRSENGNIATIDYYTNDLLDSGRYFDSSGKFESKAYETIIKSQSDTIKIGSKFLVRVSINPITKITNGKIDFYINDSKLYQSAQFNIGKPVFSDKFNGVYSFEKIFTKPGNYTLECWINFLDDGYKTSPLPPPWSVAHRPVPANSRTRRL